MKRIEYFELFANLFQYKTIHDEKGNEYVLFADNPVNSVEYVQDHTAFEAVQNHVHLICKVQKNEFQRSAEIAKKLGLALLNNLHAWYPNKSFYVFVSCRHRDSLIIRFHQKWKNEAPYFMPDEFVQEKEIVVMFET